jgi:coenzyme PQQ synthesis protein D (PqqD)
METARQPLPQAREKGLLTCEVADELLVYDLDRHKAHCLNSTAAFVWRQCDGRTDVAEMTRALNRASGAALDEEAVWLALEQLRRAHLIDETFKQPGSSTLTRRELIKRAGVAAAVGLPLITSIMAPTAVEAATCRAFGAACTTGSQCCSGSCILLLCG